MNSLVKSCVGTLQRIATQTAENVGRIYKNFGGEQSQTPHREHGLGAVDQRDGFLRFENNGFDLCVFHRIGAGDTPAVSIDALPLADQRQCKVREWCKIAAGANASL